MGTIIEYQHARDASLLPQLIEIHIICVLTDHMLARFLPPFTNEKKLRMKDFYAQRIEAVNVGTQHLFLCVDGEAGSSSRVVMGMVFLSKPWAETGPFRAGVELLMVSPDHRRKGVAKRLMGKLEAVAMEHKRSLLLLDTEEGSDAEFVYPRLGYTESGRVPDYGYSPKDHRLTTGVYFYKHLSKPLAEPYAPL